MQRLQMFVVVYLQPVHLKTQLQAQRHRRSRRVEAARRRLKLGALRGSETGSKWSDTTLFNSIRTFPTLAEFQL